MNHASLFSGIGGFDLAAQWMGWKNVMQCEIDPFCQRVLQHHFPSATLYGDIRNFDGTNGKAKSTSSQEDSRASLFPMPGEDEARKITASFGQKCYELYEKYLPYGLSLRTCVASLVSTPDWYSSECALTWRVRGTASSRLLFQLAPSALPTDGTEFGFLPTPTVSDTWTRTMNSTEQKENSKHSLDLLPAVKRLIPTIGANEGKGTSRKRYRSSKAYKGAKTAEYMRTSEEDDTYLHPSFAELMMGFPMGWTELPPAETPSSRRLPIKSSEP